MTRSRRARRSRSTRPREDARPTIASVVDFVLEVSSAGTASVRLRRSCPATAGLYARRAVAIGRSASSAVGPRPKSSSVGRSWLPSGLRARSSAAFGSSATLAAFRVAGYPALWLSEAAAGFGRAATQVAIGWIALAATDSVLAVGATFAIRLVPALLFGIPLGGLVDRYDRRITLILVNLAATVPLLLAAVVGCDRDVGRHRFARVEPRARRDRHAPGNGHADVLVRSRRRRPERRMPSRSATSACSWPAAVGRSPAASPWIGSGSPPRSSCRR